MTPAWILDMLAAVMLVVAAVSTARLAAARHSEGSGVIDTDLAGLLMAIAMAGMLAPGLSALPSTAWEVIFGVITGWFAVRLVLDARASGVRALAGGHCSPHLVHGAATLYMFLAMAAPGAGMSGMPGASGRMKLDHPTLAFIFALILIGYTIWDLDQLSGYRSSFVTSRMSLAGANVAGVTAMAAAEFLLSSAVTVGCRIVMGTAMAFMLTIAT